MSEVTRILDAIDSGDPKAAEQLLPLVYDELRKLAAAKLAEEKPGQTLQATALVHEAYLRLVARGDASTPRDQQWNSRGHFFAAAAEAMRRILVDQARQKRSLNAAEIGSESRLINSTPSPRSGRTKYWRCTRLLRNSRQPTPKLPNWSSCATSRDSPSGKRPRLSESRPAARTFSGRTPAPGFSRNCRASSSAPAAH